ncbi:MAG: hypothetical protein ACE5HT_04735 [Gemmatimonadales bacterium]
MILRHDEVGRKALRVTAEDGKPVRVSGCHTGHHGPGFEIFDEMGSTIGTVCRPEGRPRFGRSQETLYLCRDRH